MPIVVVNVTNVPLWASVPADSITVAVMSADPLTGTTVVLLKSVSVEPLGAVSGTVSHPTANTSAQASAIHLAGKENPAKTRIRDRKQSQQTSPEAGAIMPKALTRIASCI